MILIAPDKYRGTMSAAAAARIIAANISAQNIIVPMADGGEGTAACVAADTYWQFVSDGCFYNPMLREVAIDSSAVVGYGCYPTDMPPLERSTQRLGERLNDMADTFNPRRIYIGVGGTATCDAGVGMLETLSPGIDWKHRLVGLIDVEAPLLPTHPGDQSALSFCPQKGFSIADIETARQRLEEAVARYGTPISRFDGAGGGLGYALASVIGAECHLGAQWLLDRARIPWNDITLVITGEGCYDCRTALGKVVSTVAHTAHRHGIPAVCIAGTVDPDAQSLPDLRLIDTSQFLPDRPLTPDIARRRLALATQSLNF